MPFEMHFVREPNLAVLRATGPVNVAEIMSVGATLFGSPKWRPGTRVLLDYRRTPDITDGTFEAACALVEQDLSFGALLVGSRVAVVAPSNVVFGIVRMWETMSDGAPWEVQVFRDYEPALAWLEVSPTDVPEPSSR